MFSSVTGEKMTHLKNPAGYWKENMTSTVQFCSAFTTCIKEQRNEFLILEVGPHPALKGPAKEILQSEGIMHINYLYSLFRSRNDFEVLLENVGDMIASGVAVVKRNVNAKEVVHGLQCTYEYAPVLQDLPSYQWDHSTPLWYEARTSRNQRFRKFPRHQILGSRYLEDSPLNPSWRSLLRLEEVPWLADLKVGRLALAGYA
jgi:acyl transferase domain-containing protein